MEDPTGIASKVVDRYSQGGIVSLSFGLLLLALIYYAWQLNKQSVTERAAHAEQVAKDRAESMAQQSKDRGEYMAHVIRFTEATERNTAVTQRATDAIEELSTKVDKLADRVDRIDGRKA